MRAPAEHTTAGCVTAMSAVHQFVLVVVVLVVLVVQMGVGHLGESRNGRQ